MTVERVEQRYVDELLSAIRGPCKADYPDESPLVTDDFKAEFRTALLIHHYFLKAPLATTSFDAAFIRAAKSAGHNVDEAPEGQRFWDVRVRQKRISLKSTSAADLNIDFLHISKLCEAAWIQDMRTAQERERRTKELFVDFTSSVESIMQLRNFKKKAFYELVEIPICLFEQVKNVRRSHFAADGPTIGIPVGQSPPDFQLKLDRSDAKITLARIRKDRCRVLGTWQLEKIRY